MAHAGTCHIAVVSTSEHINNIRMLHNPTGDTDRVPAIITNRHRDTPQ